MPSWCAAGRPAVLSRVAGRAASTVLNIDPAARHSVPGVAGDGGRGSRSLRAPPIRVASLWRLSGAGAPCRALHRLLRSFEDRKTGLRPAMVHRIDVGGIRGEQGSRWPVIDTITGSGLKALVRPLLCKRNDRVGAPACRSGPRSASGRSAAGPGRRLSTTVRTFSAPTHRCPNRPGFMQAFPFLSTDACGGDCVVSGRLHVHPLRPSGRGCVSCRARFGRCDIADYPSVEAGIPMAAVPERGRERVSAA